MTDTKAPPRGRRARLMPRIPLSIALECGWIEFWYQPKIDLHRREVMGAEIFARVKHPWYGVLSPSTFMPGADAKSLTALTERALLSALETSVRLTRAGINLPITINVPANVLATFPFSKIIEKQRPDPKKWAGLIFDISERHIFTQSNLIATIIEKLQPHGVKIATDDFGRCLSMQMGLQNLPAPQMELDEVLRELLRFESLGIAEMKLDRSFVGDCGTNQRSAAICKAVIDLAHALGTKVVGIGIERSSDVEALKRMGCDIGQGFVFAQPMYRDTFVMLLRAKKAKYLDRQQN
jgi:EAL domain-containing protein (putative c-di-GMP-specific phosphodiesterase class I)